MDNTREQVIDKIKKLLSLSGNNPSEKEATAAALKAQALIARYNIEEFELSEEGDKPISIMSGVGQHKSWRIYLAQTIADNFRCKMYLSSSTASYRSWSGRKCTRTESQDVVFFGYSMDAEAAKLTYESLYKIGNRLANREANRARKEYGYADGVYNSFANGFVRGVREELEVQAQALMIVVPPQVKDAYEDMTSGWGTSKIRSPRSRYFAYDASGAGRSAGRDAVREGRLVRGDQHALAGC